MRSDITSKNIAISNDFMKIIQNENLLRKILMRKSWGRMGGKSGKGEEGVDAL
jgi:hypothetical protein